MRRIAILLAALFMLSTTASCIVHTRDRGHRHSKVKKKKKKCHPSQYWDGRKCRHKGKGKGARKHDGRRR
jgi:hypothetical protein